MKTQIKICQNCKSEFIIDTSDFAFYEKIKVPSPTFCPECRLVRRLAWRNERTFYKRACDFSGENIISVFDPKKEYKAYSSRSWWSDEWDALSYGLEYDESTPFFNQLDLLIKKTPLLGQYTVSSTLINSDYSNMAIELKNCYMITNADYNEDCLYSSFIAHSNNCADCFAVNECEKCYEITNCVKCYNVFYSSDCNNCVDVYLSKNLVDCSNCFGCVNLKHKQYYIFNKPYSKEDYFKKLKEIDMGKYENVDKFKKTAKEIWWKNPAKYINESKNENVSGNYIYNSKNAKECYYVKDVEDCKYCCLVTPNDGSLEDSYDCSHFVAHANLSYESIQSGHKSSKVLFTIFGIISCQNVEYSLFLTNSKNCFGCVSLHNKQYCILNKQYSREDYEALVLKIKEQMNSLPYIDKKGRVYKYGEFFPSELSPFCYNETTAQEYFPLTKEETVLKGYKWKEREEKNYNITIKSEDLPDNIKDINDSITKEIIECENKGNCNDNCVTAFKIIPQELEFYRKNNLPLPRLCPNCRHSERIKQRNPMRLWKRKCECNGEKSQNQIYQNTAKHFHGENACPNEFETTYSPGREEIVYCEACYKQEIY